MEYMAHYDMEIMYIKGKDNTMADALSRLPNSVDGEETLMVATLLSVATDGSLLESICDRYRMDLFCKRIHVVQGSIDGIEWREGLLYIGGRLGTLRKDLFRLTHNTLGHFGFDKLYVSLRDSYYWPNMQRDLKDAYIPMVRGVSA